jgi:hypothetical protein
MLFEGVCNALDLAVASAAYLLIAVFSFVCDCVWQTPSQILGLAYRMLEAAALTVFFVVVWLRNGNDAEARHATQELLVRVKSLEQELAKMRKKVAKQQHNLQSGVLLVNSNKSMRSATMLVSAVEPVMCAATAPPPPPPPMMAPPAPPPPPPAMQKKLTPIVLKKSEPKPPSSNKIVGHEAISLSTILQARGMLRKQVPQADNDNDVQLSTTLRTLSSSSTSTLPSFVTNGPSMAFSLQEITNVRLRQSSASKKSPSRTVNTSPKAKSFTLRRTTVERYAHVFG